jgi:hypothetical protein
MRWITVHGGSFNPEQVFSGPTDTRSMAVAAGFGLIAGCVAMTVIRK